MRYNGSHCSLKLKPKVPKSGKSLYGDFYLRSLKDFTHIYWKHDGLYIASLPTPKDGRQWIDKNIDKINTRKWIMFDD